MNDHYTTTPSTSKPIWDGDELGITDIGHTAVCPSCKSDVSYSVRNAQAIKKLPTDLLKYLLSKKKIKSEETNAAQFFYVKKGFPAFVVRAGCSYCSKEIMIIISMKETQPQRYVIYQHFLLTAVN